MDLGMDTYTREFAADKPLMKTLSQRPNRSMMKEARYTDKHMEQTMSLTLRNRPVEFVLAELKYDPSRDLIERLRQAKESPKQTVLPEKSIEEVPENTEETSETVAEAAVDTDDAMVDSADDINENTCATELDLNPPVTNKLDSLIAREVQDDIIGELLQERDALLEKPMTLIISNNAADDKKLTSIDETLTAIEEELTAKDEKLIAIEEELATIDEKLTAIDEELAAPDDSLAQNELISEVKFSKDTNIDKEDSSDDGATGQMEFVDSNEEDFDDGSEILFSIDQDGDIAAVEEFSVSKPNTAALLQSEHQNRTRKERRSSSQTSEDGYLTIGKVILKTSRGDNGSPFVELPSLKSNKSNRSGFVSLKDTRAKENDPFAPKTAAKDHFAHSVDSDVEAAFDDYMTQLMLANGEDSDDSDSEPDNNSDAEDSDGSMSDYGVHDDDDEATFDKLRAQYDYSTLDVSDQSSIDEFDIDQVMDMSLDTDDLDELNSEEEGLEDILAFAKQHKRLADLDLGTNVAPQKVGKGRKQRLELGSDLEVELRESLMEQFQYQKQSRRLKKLRKKEKKLQEAVDNLVLKDKYEYSLHIKEIKEEFEMFLHDASRETLSFPPLDGHGNKTLNKLANNYNMKCIKSGGNGTSLYMKIAKTKKTFRYVPDYQLIGYILKQRPVFRRIDVKPRTREEIAESEDSSRRGPKSNAYVREGDIVGGLAPEIAQNNIGRKMLEMLGWSKGEGLGALGNKGISTPVLATVKKSKSGLK